MVADDPAVLVEDESARLGGATTRHESKPYKPKP